MQHWLVQLLNTTLMPLVASAWSPDGSLDHAVSASCLPHRLERNYLENHDEANRRLWLQSKIQACETEWTHGLPQGTDAEKRMSEMNLHPALGDVLTVSLPSGQTVTSWIYLQKEPSARPAVIVECDADCDNLNDPWVRSIYGQLFEESGFHLIVLQNPYGTLGARTSGQFLLGGLTRGMDILDFGFWLRVHSTLRYNISSLHLISKGLGGHAGLFTQLYNDLNPIADDRKVFNSALSLCPVADLNAWTLADTSLTETLWAVLSELKPTFPLLMKYFPESHLPVQFYQRWVDASLDQLQQRTRWLKPFHKKPPQTSEEFLQSNNFIRILHGMKTPGWTFSPMDDSTVDWSAQGRQLRTQHSDWRKTFLTVYSTEKGAHCAYPASHGWAVSGALMRLTLLSESYEIWPRRQWTLHPFSVPSPQLKEGERHGYQRWRIREDKQPAIEFVITTPCESGNCERTETVPLRWKDLSANWVNRQRQMDHSILVRMLNRNLHLATVDGHPLTETRDSAAFIEEFSQ